MWRLLLSPRLKVSRRELEIHWSIDDAAEAHLALDLAEDVEILSAPEVKP